jgi:hypothetical protein
MRQRAIGDATNLRATVMSRVYPPNTRQFRLHIMSDRGRADSRERVSDCWPDWGTNLTDGEARASADRNRPSVVLGEVIRVLAITGCLVALVEVALQVFHVQ